MWTHKILLIAVIGLCMGTAHCLGAEAPAARDAAQSVAAPQAALRRIATTTRLDFYAGVLRGPQALSIPARAAAPIEPWH
jgi:hypothetical protein